MHRSSHDWNSSLLAFCKSAYLNLFFFLFNDWNRLLQTRIINLFSYRLADTYHVACLKTKVFYKQTTQYAFHLHLLHGSSGLFGVDFFNLRAMSTTLEHCSHYTARTYLNTYFPLYSSISKYFKYLKYVFQGKIGIPHTGSIL